MKKRYRQRALSDLFSRLESSDFDEREHALFQIALLLQRSGRADAAGQLPDVAAENLPRTLLRIRLEPEDQRQIVDGLSLMIAKRHESRATALWVLGEVSAEVAWEPALAILSACGSALDTEAASQACRALRRFLRSDAVTDGRAESGIAEHNIAALLRHWAAHRDERLASAAQALVMRLGASLS